MHVFYYGAIFINNFNFQARCSNLKTGVWMQAYYPLTFPLSFQLKALHLKCFLFCAKVKIRFISHADRYMA